MAAKKINWRLSRNIASDIAKKAFEHLIAPIQAELDKFGDEAYERVLPALQTMEPFGVTCKGDTFDMVLQVSGAADDGGITVTKRGENLLAIRLWYETMKIKDSDLYARAEPFEVRYQQLRTKEEQLREELKAQLEGKTVSAAMKAWPEAADIIARHAGVTDGVPMTTPLEVLLAKFLPMLPAPQTEGV